MSIEQQRIITSLLIGIVIGIALRHLFVALFALFRGPFCRWVYRRTKKHYCYDCGCAFPCKNQLNCANPTFDCTHDECFPEQLIHEHPPSDNNKGATHNHAT